MSDYVALIVMILLLFANAFFVGAEFAVTSSRRAQIEPLVDAGKRGAASALFAVEHVSQMLATCQLGVTLASTGLGVVAEPAIAHLVEGPLKRWGMPPASAHVVGFIAALIIVLYLHVVIGEMVPKNLSVAAHLRLILIYAPILVAITHGVKWIVVSLDHFANWILRLFGVTPKAEVASVFTVDEVASIVERSQAEGVLEDNLGLLSGTLEFSRKLVKDVTIDPESVVSFPPDVTPAQVERQVAVTGFSRFLIREEGGNFLGYIHLKDVISLPEADRDLPIPSWRVRALPTVSEEMEVEEALQEMQRSGTHLAQVKGQHSGAEKITGIIFLEDILEELVGEVRDGMQRYNGL